MGYLNRKQNRPHQGGGSPQFRATNRSINQISQAASAQAQSQAASAQAQSQRAGIQVPKPSLNRTGRARFAGFTGGAPSTPEAQAQQAATDAALRAASNRVRTAGASDNNYFNPMGTLGLNPRIQQNTLQHPDGRRYALNPEDQSTQDLVSPFGATNTEIRVDDLPSGENPALYMQNDQTMTRPFSRARQVHPAVNTSRGDLPYEISPAVAPVSAYPDVEGVNSYEPSEGLIAQPTSSRTFGVGGSYDPREIAHGATQGVAPISQETSNVNFSKDTAAPAGSVAGKDEIYSNRVAPGGSYDKTLPAGSSNQSVRPIPQETSNALAPEDLAAPAGAVAGVSAVRPLTGTGYAQSVQQAQNDFIRGQQERLSRDPLQYSKYVSQDPLLGNVSASNSGVAPGGVSTTVRPDEYIPKASGERASTVSGSLTDVSGIRPPSSERASTVSNTVTDVNRVAPPSAGRASTVSNTVTDVNGIKPQLNQRASTVSNSLTDVSGIRPPSAERASTVSNTVTDVNRVAPPSSERASTVSNSLTDVSGIRPPSAERVSAVSNTVTDVNRVAPPSNRRDSAVSNTVTDVNGIKPQLNRRASTLSRTTVDYGAGIPSGGNVARGMTGAPHSYKLEAPTTPVLKINSNPLSYGNTDTDSDSGSDYSYMSSTGSSTESTFSNGGLTNTNNDQKTVQYNTTPVLNDLKKHAAEKSWLYQKQSQGDLVNTQGPLYHDIDTAVIMGVAKGNQLADTPEATDYLNTTPVAQKTARGVQQAPAPRGLAPTHYQIPSRSGTGLGVSKDTSLNYLAVNQKTIGGARKSGAAQSTYPVYHEIEVNPDSYGGVQAPQSADYLNQVPVKQSVSLGMNPSGIKAVGIAPTHYSPVHSQDSMPPISKDTSLNYVPRAKASPILLGRGTSGSPASSNLGSSALASANKTGLQPTLEPSSEVFSQIGDHATQYYARKAQKPPVKLGDPVFNPSEGSTPTKAGSFTSRQSDILNQRSYTGSLSAPSNKVSNQNLSKFFKDRNAPKKPGSYSSGDVDNYEGAPLDQVFDPDTVERGRKMLIKGKTMGQVRDALGYQSTRGILGGEHNKSIDVSKVGDVLSQAGISNSDVHQYLQYVHSQNGGTEFGDSQRTSLPHLVNPNGIKVASFIPFTRRPKF